MYKITFHHFVGIALLILCACGDDQSSKSSSNGGSANNGSSAANNGGTLNNGSANNGGYSGPTLSEVVSAYDAAQQAHVAQEVAECECGFVADGNDPSACGSFYDATPIPDCMEKAISCYPQALKGFFDCRARTKQENAECWKNTTCPADPGVCSAGQECFETTSMDALDAFSNCAYDDVMPDCQSVISSTGNNGSASSNNGSSGMCMDQALAQFYDIAVSVYYRTSSGGLEDCVDGEQCTREQLIFHSDGTATHHLTITDDWGNINSSAGTSCMTSQWTLDCDVLTISNCEFTETVRLNASGGVLWLGSRGFEQANLVSDRTWCNLTPCD